MFFQEYIKPSIKSEIAELKEEISTTQKYNKEVDKWIPILEELIRIFEISYSIKKVKTFYAEQSCPECIFVKGVAKKEAGRDQLTIYIKEPHMGGLSNYGQQGLQISKNLWNDLNKKDYQSIYNIFSHFFMVRKEIVREYANPKSVRYVNKLKKKSKKIPSKKETPFIADDIPF